jgi:hypothetical protein
VPSINRRRAHFSELPSIVFKWPIIISYHQSSFHGFSFYFSVQTT